LLPTTVEPANADYMLDPPDLPAATRALIGAVAAAAVAAAIAVVARAIRRRALERAWLPAVGLLAGLAAYLGLTYAAVTAPTVGANIGGGILLMASGLVVPVGAVAVAILALRAVRRHRQGRGGDSDTPRRGHRLHRATCCRHEEATSRRAPYPR
jgi:hypothetical protein